MKKRSKTKNVSLALERSDAAIHAGKARLPKLNQRIAKLKAERDRLQTIAQGSLEAQLEALGYVTLGYRDHRHAVESAGEARLEVKPVVPKPSRGKSASRDVIRKGRIVFTGDAMAVGRWLAKRHPKFQAKALASLERTNRALASAITQENNLRRRLDQLSLQRGRLMAAYLKGS